MKPFTFSRPADIKSAQQLYKKNEASQFIAGGTNLLDLMKKEITMPANLVDINSLSLKEITTGDAGIFIGSLALNSVVAAHPDIIKSLTGRGFCPNTQYGYHRREYFAKNKMPLFL